MTAIQKRINRITGISGSGARKRESRKVQSSMKAHASATGRGK